MVVSPCLSPVRVTKPDGSKVFVPCGHCPACIAGKGFSRSFRLSDVLTHFRYQYFVTLTYKDEYLPFADFIDGDLVHSVDTDYKGRPIRLSGVSAFVDDSCTDLLSYCNEHYSGRVPVLSRQHLINFKKRFRYYLDKKLKDLNEHDEEKLFIYACAEYGPTNYRPHYHLLLCTNSRVKSSLFEECVYQAWSVRVQTSSRHILREAYGRIDIQRVVTGNVASYVASYVNSPVHLPRLLSCSRFRQFSTSSSLCTYEYSQYQVPDLATLLFRGDVTIPYVSPKDSSVTDVPLPNFIKSRVFPVFTGFGLVDYWSRVSLYRVFEVFPHRQTFIDYFWYKFELGLSAYPDTLNKSLYLLYYVDGTKESFEHNLTKLWYASRKVVTNCRFLQIPLPVYVKCIEHYLSNVSLHRLSEFYQLQADLLKSGAKLSSLISLYYDTEDSLTNLSIYHAQFGFDAPNAKVTDFKEQRLYELKMRKIVLETTKTKKRNGYFDRYNLKRPVYIPKLKSSYLKFCKS